MLYKKLSGAQHNNTDDFNQLKSLLNFKKTENRETYLFFNKWSAESDGGIGDSSAQFHLHAIDVLSLSKPNTDQYSGNPK